MAGIAKNPAPAEAAAETARFPEVMTIDQVADYLHLHKQVVYRHVKRGNIPASRIGTTIRFKKSVIDAWLEESARRSLRGGTRGAAAAKPGTREKFVWE
ncbi:MAG: helix-turn-helix domain-containing protein [Chlamydiae bacterium]|jgi:excisionase family DNA binding protein|nr:helix-turn-helix domain-containing protein [Chlamydiota bacterium]